MASGSAILAFLNPQIPFSDMARTSFEELEVYQLAEELSDEIWKLVRTWPRFARSTMGRQMCRSADSVGANIAEGVGRKTFKDNRRFVRFARGSLYETKHWLRRAHQRNLLSEERTERLKPIIDELLPRLNAYLNSLNRRIGN